MTLRKNPIDFGACRYKEEGPVGSKSSLWFPHSKLRTGEVGTFLFFSCMDMISRKDPSEFEACR